MAHNPHSPRPDIYARITDRIIADLEQGVRLLEKRTLLKNGTKSGEHVIGLRHEGLRLPAHYTAKAEAHALSPLQRIEAADWLFAATGADIRHGGARAFYVEGPDYVQMPPFETFRDAESHAATLAHDLTHWTKHDKRLARDMGHVKWGDEVYAREELVAELGAAFLCADLGITPEVRQDHAAYIQSWLEVLKNDKRFVFSAASHAQRAANYLHGLQPRQANAEPPEEERAAAYAAPSLPPALFASLRRPAMFTNHYECPRCACTWSDTWSCQCDDDCPSCGMRHISPIDSEDGGDSADEEA